MTRQTEREREKRAREKKTNACFLDCLLPLFLRLAILTTLSPSSSFSLSPGMRDLDGQRPRRQNRKLQDFPFSPPSSGNSTVSLLYPSASIVADAGVFVRSLASGATMTSLSSGNTTSAARTMTKRAAPPPRAADRVEPRDMVSSFLFLVLRFSFLLLRKKKCCCFRSLSLFSCHSQQKTKNTPCARLSSLSLPLLSTSSKLSSTLPPRCCCHRPPPATR